MMVANVIYHFDGDPADEAAWQAFVAEHSEPSVKEQASAPPPATRINTLYELFLLFVVVVALVGTLLWQQSTTQIEVLEAEVEMLQAELAVSTTEPEVAATSIRGARTLAALPVLHVVETEFFHFVVAAENLGAVTSVVPDIDEAYRRLCADLGEISPTVDQKHLVCVTAGSERDKLQLCTTLGIIAIDLAPARAPVTSAAVAPADLLSTALFGQLAQRLLDQAVSSRTIKPQWQVLVGSLYPYVTENHLPQAVAALQPYALRNRQYAQQLAPRQVQLTYEPGEWMFPDRQWANVIAGPLVEYIFVTYGRASVPALLDALSEYDEWDDVVVAVFAISPDQFAAEWHAYLQQQYPMDLADSY